MDGGDQLFMGLLLHDDFCPWCRCSKCTARFCCLKMEKRYFVTTCMTNTLNNVTSCVCNFSPVQFCISRAGGEVWCSLWNTQSVSPRSGAPVGSPGQGQNTLPSRLLLLQLTVLQIVLVCKGLSCYSVKYWLQTINACTYWTFISPPVGNAIALWNRVD